jgi:NADH dehydrogenase
MTKIVVVGGGAGGMELMGSLSKPLRHCSDVSLTLVDISNHHIWKPLLHELASGSLDEGLNAVDYRAHAARNGYHFEQGELIGLDRFSRKVILAPQTDAQGTELVPERSLEYDYLVLGIGAVTNDFGIPGVQEHCEFLDLTQQAMSLRQKLLNRFLQQANEDRPEPFNITIVGAGATGTEMAAEMHHVADILEGYGYTVGPDQLKVNLVEAGPHVMPALPKSCLRDAVEEQLQELGVQLFTDTRVTSVTADGLYTQYDQMIPSDITIWAAGVKGPQVLSKLGLEVNGQNQLMVEPNCRSLSDSRIFAFGDCAACPQPDGSFTPPRGQTARQMALMIADNLLRLLDDREAPLKEYLYKDLGSFVNMAKFHTVGNLFSFIRGGIAVQGCPARFVYASLYRRHMLALHGPIKGLALLALNGMQRWFRPQLKLW